MKTLAKSSSKKQVVKLSHKYEMKKYGGGATKQKVILYGKAKDGKVVFEMGVLEIVKA